MELVFFSIKTKGIHNFARRLKTVFTRFGFTQTKTQRALCTVVDALREHQATPTFFIPAVVLGRHPALLAEIASYGAEIGIHGYVHNDYRLLSAAEQYKQTEKAIHIFNDTHIPFLGFRNPYLGWTETAVEVFTQLGFTYDSNDAVIHDVIDLEKFSPLLRSGYQKSLALFQAIAPSEYSVRPYFAEKLVRIPTSIPDDEMLFDRMRITDPQELGRIWESIMQRVYDLGGIYTLNLHPERVLLCEQALKSLLSYARNQSPPIWIANLRDVASWWQERSQFRLTMTPLAPEHWQVEAVCTPRATLLTRGLVVEEQATTPWFKRDRQVQSHRFTVQASRCPCIGLSTQTPQEVEEFLFAQGYPFMRCSPQDAQKYAYYIDAPEGLGTTREEQIQRKSKLVQSIEELEAPLIYFGCWPNGSRAALSITGDIDSVTIQDFFLRILEVHQSR